MKDNEVELLKKIVVDSQGNCNLPFDVSRIEKIIKEKIPATLEKNAPPILSTFTANFMTS